ncbi:hypothetical protein, partial [Klebsiella pneumoniae]|uniref:hypothetical protein n=1 Tax=Klebsiella pneumoniae TaxID=573 RepID=UPI0021086807
MLFGEHHPALRAGRIATMMFIVWVGSLLTTLLAIAMAGGALTGSATFTAAGYNGEKGLRFAPLALKDFHRQPIVGLYCRAHRQLMRLEKML